MTSTPLFDAATVRHALAAIRYDRPQPASPLLDMAWVTAELRAEGLADTRRGREWALGRCLAALAGTRLAALRGASDASALPAPPDPAAELAALAADFRAGSAEREAWGVLYSRFLSPHRLAVGDLADHLGVTERTLERRVAAACATAARAVHAAEAAHAARAPASAGDRVPVVVTSGERGVGAPGGSSGDRAGTHDADAGLADVAGGLLAAIRGGIEARLTEADARALALRAPRDLDGHRLGRVAEWSQPRYRLDVRFVALTLLVDHGVDDVGGRWQPEPRVYDDLRAVLAATVDPALVVLGPPGSGKSTLLRRLDLDLAVAGLRDETAQVAWFVPLGRYAGDGGPPPAPLEWLAGLWAARGAGLPPFVDLVRAGRMVLLLDGLNEVPHADAAGYHAVVVAWKRFLQSAVTVHPGNRVVFSCRSLEYSAPLSSPVLPVPQVRVEPLDDAGIRAFLRSHLPGAAEAAWAAVAAAPDRAVYRSPYLLRLLVDTIADTGRAPSGPAALFTDYVRRALRREIGRDHPLFAPGALLSARDVARAAHNRGWPSAYALPGGALVGALSDLALAMQRHAASHEGARVRLAFDAALACLGRPDGEDVVRAGEALGVLDEDREHDELCFGHQLLQEYFAARRIAAEPEPGLAAAEWRAGALRPALADVLAALGPAEPLPPPPAVGWDETMALAAAMTGDADAFVVDLAAHNLALAGRAAAAPEVAARLSAGAVAGLRAGLVDRLRDRGADVRARIEAGFVLGRLGDPRFPEHAGPFGAYRLPEMVAFGGGASAMGGDAELEHLGYLYTAHRPRHAVALAPFALGRYPVTVAEWGCFVAAGGYDDDRWWDTPAGQAWRRGEGTRAGVRANMRRGLGLFGADPALLEDYHATGQIHDASYARWRRWLALSPEAFEADLVAEFPDERYAAPRTWDDPRHSGPNQPVTGISWFEARAYCAWLAAQTGRAFRLPTEAEWEHAAAGAAGRRFAYGDAFDPLAANTHAAHVRQPSPVGAFPAGDTPEGLVDMTGNVYEWTASAWGRHDEAADFSYPYDPADGREAPDLPDDVRRVMRGGSWNDPALQAHAVYRGFDHPGGRGPDYGMRLACG